MMKKWQRGFSIAAAVLLLISTALFTGCLELDFEDLNYSLTREPEVQPDESSTYIDTTEIASSEETEEDGAGPENSSTAETSIEDPSEATTSMEEDTMEESTAIRPTEPDVVESESSGQTEEKEYRFRSKKLKDQHYEKHGIEMGFKDADAYEAAASAVVNNPNALHKTEAEDGDDIYYLEDTNDFVVVSTDGYIRTYFWPSAGKKYYDRQ